MTSNIDVPSGACIVGVRFRRTGKTGHATLVINDTECGTVDIPFVMRMISSVGPSVGYDHGSQVSNEYEGPFPFEGHLQRLDIQLISERRGEAAENAAADERATMARQ